MLLEDLSNDRDGRVDGVGNDQDVSLGAVPTQEKDQGRVNMDFQSQVTLLGDDVVETLLGAALGQIADNGSVGVEQIVTGHTGLARNTSYIHPRGASC